MAIGVAIAVNSRPDDELAGATMIEVTERVGQATAFRLRYDIAVDEGDLPLLVDGRLGPGSPISILVPVDAQQHCLVNGPVHGQSIHMEHGGAGSWVEVRGSDSSIVMDRETKAAVWSDLTDSDAVTAILAGYGYIPDVERTSAGHFQTGHTLVQRDSDLRFVRRLAMRNGFLFWVTSDALGIETAHFRRPPLSGDGEAELTINLEQPSIDTLDIEWDVERPTSVVASQLNLNAKSDLSGDVPVSPSTVLGTDSLQAITGDTRSIHVAAPADDAGDLQARGEGALTQAEWFIRATTRTSLETLGKLVRTHTLVKVRGAGSRHSGNYFVTAVRHLIDDTAHVMELELARNGWGG